MKTHGKTRLILEMPQNSFRNIREGPNSSNPPEQPAHNSLKPDHHAFQKPTVLSPL